MLLRLPLMLILLLASATAHACIEIRRPDLRTIRDAQLVAVGEVTGFTTYDPVKDQTFDEYVVMEVVIDKVLKGEADPTIRLVWTNSLNAAAPIGVGKQTILFAAHPVRKPEERFRDPDRELWSQAEWNVAYQSCSAAYIDAWSLQRETA